MRNATLLTLLLAPLAYALDDPGGGIPVEPATLEIKCGESETPMEAGGQTKTGEILVPHGTAPGSATVLNELIEDHERNYHCADCDDELRCYKHSNDSTGTFTLTLIKIGSTHDTYKWSSDNFAVVISCSDC